MSEAPESRAAALRQAFDASFAHPVAVLGPTEDLLIARVGGDAYALPLTQVTALLTGRKVVPVPSHHPAVLGLAAAHGTLVPVYGLATLLGYPEASLPRWLALTAGATPLALAFAELLAHVRVDRQRLQAIQGAPRAHVSRVAQLDSGPAGVIDVAELVTAIAAAAPSTAAPTRE